MMNDGLLEAHAMRTKENGHKRIRLGSFFAPFVLLANLFFFSGIKVVLNVEGFSNFFRIFTLYHVSHSFTGYIKETFDVQVISSLKGRENESEENQGVKPPNHHGKAFIAPQS